MSKKKAPKIVKSFTPAKKAKMLSMLQHGHTVYYIAKQLDLTPSVARYHALKLAPEVKGYTLEAFPKNHALKAVNNLPGRQAINTQLENKLISEIEELKVIIEELKKENEGLCIKIKILKELIGGRY